MTVTACKCNPYFFHNFHPERWKPEGEIWSILFSGLDVYKTFLQSLGQDLSLGRASQNQVKS